MAKVLVTGAGGACGIGAIRTLRKRTDHAVVGVDMNSQAAGIYLADYGQAVPAATDDGWTEEMQSVINTYDVDIVIPTVDEELANLTSLSTALSADVQVIAPRPEVIDVALDKYRTHERLAAAGHSVPQTWSVEERNNVDESAYPLLVKPRRGRGSRGIQRVDSEDALDAHLAECGYDPERLLLQEFVDGTEFTTSVVATSDDRLLAVVPKEAIEKRGSTVTGVTRDAKPVVESCRSIADTLAPAGPMNVQQVVDERGIPYTIEINPRFSSTSCLTAAAGVDEFDLLIREALGEEVTPPESFETDLYIRRYDDHIFVPAEEFGRPQTNRD